MQSSSIMKVDKSELVNHKFYSKKRALILAHTNKEVLMYELNRALKLGNLYKIKVTIRFVSDRELLETEATIWALTDNYVTLKGGVIIPVECIIDVYI